MSGSSSAEAIPRWLNQVLFDALQAAGIWRRQSQGSLGCGRSRRQREGLWKMCAEPIDGGFEVQVVQMDHQVDGAAAAPCRGSSS